jgi:hypothetical protein
MKAVNPRLDFLHFFHALSLFCFFKLTKFWEWIEYWTKYSTVIGVDRSFLLTIQSQVFRAINKYVRAYEAVHWTYTNQPGVLFT